LIDHGILAGDRICIIEVPELADEMTALSSALTSAGAEIVRVALPDVLTTRGRGWVSQVDAVGRKIECDLVAVAAIPSPASEGARQQGCRVVLDPAGGGFKIVVDGDGKTTTPNVWACGDVTGYMGPAAAAADGARVGDIVAAAI
jgi:thioredoxin reductase